MRSIRWAGRIAGAQLSKWKGQARIWIVLLFVPLVLHPALRPVWDMARAEGLPISPMGMVFVFNDMYGSALSMLFGIGAVVLFSDAPFYDTAQQQCLLRTGKRVWISAQFLYVGLLSIGYVLYWIAWVLLMLATQLDWTLEWGTLWKTLAYTNAHDVYGMVLDCPVALIRQYTPMRSLLLSVGLRFSLCILLGCLTFAAGLLTRTNAGVYASLVLMMQDYLTMNGKGLPYIWFAPASMSRLVMLDPRGTGVQPTPSEALLILWGITLLCVMLVQLPGKKATLE